MSDTAERPSDIVELDRVIIRFAGDSGDGMQLTGDRFTNASALFGNDLATLPEYPAEIRAPAGTIAGVSAFQVHISDHDITTPGDAPNVLVAMNPAALKSQLGSLDRGGTLIVNTDTFDDRNLAKAGYDENPLSDGSLGGYTVYEVPMTHLTKDAVAPLGVKPRDAERSKNFFALGLVSWMYTRPEAPTLDWIHSQVRQEPPGRGSQPGGLQGRPRLRRDRRAVRPRLHRQGRHPRARASTPTSPATPPWPGGSSPPASRPSCRCSSAATRSRRRPTSSTSCRSTRTSASARCRPRTRSPASPPPSAPPSAATSASPPPAAPAWPSSPRPSAWPSAWSCRCSSSTSSAAVPSTGLPTKTEQADLLQAMYGRHGESPVPDRRRQDVVRLLLRRHRGRPHRAQVPHAGVPALRRLPGQRLRAVAPARRRRPARPHGRVRHRAEPHQRRRHRGLLALPARPRDAGPAVGRPGHAGPRCTASVASRSRTAPATSSYDAGQPRQDDPRPRGQDRRHRQGHPRRGRRRRRRRRPADRRLGLHLGRHRRGASTGAACAA